MDVPQLDLARLAGPRVKPPMTARTSALSQLSARSRTLRQAAAAETPLSGGELRPPSGAGSEPAESMEGHSGPALPAVRDSAALLRGDQRGRGGPGSAAAPRGLPSGSALNAARVRTGLSASGAAVGASSLLQDSWTPSERIGSLLSPRARGLSPRLLAAGAVPYREEEFLAGRPGSSRPPSQRDSGGVSLVDTPRAQLSSAFAATAAATEQDAAAGGGGGGASLPLEMFDDTEESSAYQALLERMAEGEKSIAARSKYFATDGSFEWRGCVVEEHDPYTASFSIRWQQSGRTKSVKRLNLMLPCDDKASYKARIARATHNRGKAAANLKLNAFSGGRPISNVTEMEPAQLERIVKV